MILDDLNKIFLYQKLNLGYECNVCKCKFFNRLDHLAHIIHCKKVPKKKVGLTKVRMEDCLRCDECSCIYIDSRDYYKHMRNFHKIDLINNVLIEPPASKRRCRSCCKQCRGQNCSSPKRPRASRPGSDLIFEINVRDNFQNRLTRALSGQTPVSETQVASLLETDVKPDLDAIAIKPDPDVDLSHLLSQVEVKIKTEPEDHYD